MGNLLTRASSLTKILVAVAVVALIVAAAVVALPQQSKSYLTVSFPRAVSLYEGSDVRILGVPVGKVETVTPTGTDVTVKMYYDSQYKVPANAKAVIISPAIVGDRYVQLTPVYHGGKTMPDNASLSVNRTASPLELDQIYQSIDQLTVALGPQGANKQGSLSRLINSTADNFRGQGEQFHRTLTNFGKFTGTLSNNRQALFGTVREIERFVGSLSRNDQTVRRFNDSLQAAANLLAGERKDLAKALRNLGTAMVAVRGFVKENRRGLSRNIKGLNVVTNVLVKQRKALDEVLQDAPTALTNLYHTYNPNNGTLDTRSNLGENINALTSNPIAFACSLLTQGGAPKSACDTLKKSLPIPGGTGTGARSANRPSALAGPSRGSGKPTQVEYVDRSLGGILAVRR